MNIIDLILSIFLLLGMVRGIFKGFLIELAGLLALIIGVYAAIHFSRITYDFLALFFGWDEKVLSIIAFALTFFLVALMILLIAKILTKMVHLLALGLVNRLLGGLFGIVKMAFLASLLFMFLNSFDLFHVDRETQESSVLYEPVRAFAPLVLPTIIMEVEKQNTDPADNDKEQEQ